ncbi:MAG TPA: glycosyltransferase family 2 protein [Vicinamibacterales bacterium]|nr:glycosyltransferase family 2 protein [Vicinamibacterales bacterium]
MLLSIIIPLYNEEAVLPLLVARLNDGLARLDCESEIILVDDGSRDRTPALARQAARDDPRYRVLSFSRNFGHQAAITAGLDFAAGDAVVIMDADLQDPPEIIGRMLELYHQGYDVVSAQRESREGDGAWKRATASIFYWLMRRTVDERIMPEVADFRLLSRGAVHAVRQFREQHRFMRGLIAWLGLKEATVQFKRGPRAAGTTKYPTLKMAAFAWTAITSFSGLPLRFGVLAGMFLTLLGGLYFVYAAYRALVVQATVPGWTSLVFLQIFFSGATLLSIGLVGEYLARVYDESKRRPLYVLRDMVNVPLQQSPRDRVVIIHPRDDHENQEVR